VDIPKTFRQWILARRPSGNVVEDDIKMVTANMPETLDKGHFIVAVKFLSVDPYMRGLMNESGYGIAIPINGTMRGGASGIVVKSENPSFKVGDAVSGQFGWTEYAVSNGMLVKKIPADFPLSHTLGVLGMPGATAFHGLFDLCVPKPGDTVFVSGAAGAVGNLVGQLAKLSSCRVIGSVGSNDKAKWLTSLGFDSVLVYKDKDFKKLHEELKTMAPNGIDCYFDNTGGLMSEVVFSCLNQFSRVAVCGQIAHYNSKDEKVMTRPFLADCLSRQIKVEGFMVGRWTDWTGAHTKLNRFIKENKLVVKEDIMEGFDKMRDAFMGLFTGQNTGKAIVKA